MWCKTVGGILGKRALTSSLSRKTDLSTIYKESTKEIRKHVPGQKPFVSLVEKSPNPSKILVLGWCFLEKTKREKNALRFVACSQGENKL